MPDFRDLNNFYLILLFVVPGFVIVFVRSQFISGPRPSNTDNALGYVALSILYYTFALPILDIMRTFQAAWLERAIIWISLTVVGPAIFGLLVGAAAQKEWGRKFANLFGLTTIHVIPAAWDWRFSKIPRGGMFVMITLASGETVAGFFGPGSFASSDTAERDFYIEEEYDVSDDGKWQQRESKVGILVPVKEIRYIEFWEP